LPVCAVSFSEIMYDAPGSDAGREWMEIFNDGSEPLDLSQWQLVEAGVRHKITAERGMIAPHGYGVIAANTGKFLADWPSYSGALFDSAFSLSNTGESLVLENASSSPVSVTYAGKTANGNSLNLVDGSFVLRAPTPGTPASANVLAAPNAVPKTSAKDRNISAAAAVREESGQSPSVGIGETASPGAAGHAEGRKSGIIFWILGLLAIVAVGVGAIFFTAPKVKTGYTIIEDNS
jgi:hypothetical protein